MRAVSREEMMEIDRASIETYGIPGHRLMEEAGKAVAQHAAKMVSRKTAKICVVCGSGNNGGDGLVAARYLLKKGCKPKVILLAEKEKLEGDALAAFQAFKKVGGKFRFVTAVSEVAEELKEQVFVIDAIFGTGLRCRDGKSERLSLPFMTIGLINILRQENSIKIVLAVDLPSGMDSNTGLSGVEGEDFMIRADVTVTMGLPKLGCLSAPGAQFCGKMQIASLPFAKEVMHVEDPAHQFVEPKDFSAHLSRRSVDVHKGDFGHVLMIGGSLRMPGAMNMAVAAALRSGAGKVTAMVPGKEVSIALAATNPESMWFPVDADEEGYFSEKSAEALTRFLETWQAEKQVIVVGPGMGQSQGGKLIVEVLFRHWENGKTSTPLVVDADALNICAKYKIKSKVKAEKPLVLTPHPAEMARLLQDKTEHIQMTRIQSVQRAAKEFNAWTVLKGFRTLIASPSGYLDINPTGNPGMATPGMGDVLAGILGARLATVKGSTQPKIWRQAIQASVFVHGLAADLAVQETGEESLLARDVLHFLPQAFLACQSSGLDIL